MKNQISKSVKNEILEMQFSKVQKTNLDNTNLLVLIYFVVMTLLSSIISYLFL